MPEEPMEQSQMFWSPTMIEAKRACARRQWATLGALLAQASHAPDAPVLDGEYGGDVATWHELMDELVLHQIEAEKLVRVAVRLLMTQARARLGASGVPDPTPQEQLAQILADADALDMDVVDAIVADEDEAASVLERFRVRDPSNEEADDA